MGAGGDSHIFVVNFAFLRVCYGFLHCFRLSFLKSNFFAQISVPIGQYLVWVESQHVFIADTIRDAVTVQFIPKNRGGNTAFFLVLILDGVPEKPKKMARGKVCLIRGIMFSPKTERWHSSTMKTIRLDCISARSAAFSAYSASSLILLIFWIEVTISVSAGSGLVSFAIRT